MRTSRAKMTSFITIAGLDAFSATWRNSVPVHLGIGIYDGVHSGHRAIFARAKQNAQADGGVCGALTFEPHPEVFFKGSGAIKLIYSRAQKNALFMENGLDFALYERFTHDFAMIDAETFVPFLKSKIPTLSTLYVGENFRFGAKRAGDVSLLSALGKRTGVAVEVVPAVLFAGTKISSTRIREALVAGAIADAGTMLARPYFSTGTVEHGRKLGRTIGFPTLNLRWKPELLPRFGVYAVRLKGREQVFDGIANYGVRPTVERELAPAPLLETHLLRIAAGAPIPSYGDAISVSWTHFIRSEEKFSSLDALVAQIERDKASLKIIKSVPAK